MTFADSHAVLAAPIYVLVDAAGDRTGTSVGRGGRARHFSKETEAELFFLFLVPKKFLKRPTCPKNPDARAKVPLSSGKPVLPYIPAESFYCTSTTTCTAAAGRTLPSGAV